REHRTELRHVAFARGASQRGQCGRAGGCESNIAQCVKEGLAIERSGLGPRDLVIDALIVRRRGRDAARREQLECFAGEIGRIQIAGHYRLLPWEHDRSGRCGVAITSAQSQSLVLSRMRATHNYKVSVRPVSPYVLVATALVASSAAGGIDESRTIRTAVDAFVRAQTEALPGHVEIKSGLVDPQLKFTHCEHLDVFVPPGAKLWGNTTVGVRCEVPEKWSLYVPVQVRVWADVVLSARALPRGQTITADDVAMQ